MAGTSEPPALLPGRLRPAWWHRGMPQTQTAYVAVAFAALIVVIWILAPVFMTPRNLLNISKNFSFIALMSLGETLVIISGGIDLSVGSVCALSAVVTMMLMRFLSASAARTTAFCSARFSRRRRDCSAKGANSSHSLMGRD